MIYAAKKKKACAKLKHRLDDKRKMFLTVQNVYGFIGLLDG
jgi:hypothetical protein